jgi:PAS domain S-box-containing protein
MAGSRKLSIHPNWIKFEEERKQRSEVVMSEPEAALHEQHEWLRVTLSSIGDAVITTDTSGNITFLNAVAQSLTGWTLEQATGVPLHDVFNIVNEETRRTVENPATRAMREGLVIGLANHSLLVGKDGTERPIDDSAAPIRNSKGEIAGVVLVFRDVTDRRRQEHALRDCLTYCENIVRTLREPFLVMDERLRVRTANRAFYDTFQVSPEETVNRSVFELGNRQWDIPKLRTLLQEILPNNHSFHDFVVEHDFPTIGRRTILLNARQIRRDSDGEALILLAMDDITESRRQKEALEASERRYRRLFESARDGILILDARTGKIVDANPFMTEMLDYTKDELLGRELWEIGLFQDIEVSRAAFRELQDRGYIRYEDLPLQSKSGRQADVEFVSNLYRVDHTPIIQCNVRDITTRRQLEKAKVQAETLADSNRRKDEFLAMLSHELRNPLSAIMNASHLLSIDSANETPIQQEARGMIERQVAQLAHLVDDLLEVSRISTGRIRLYPEHVDMRGIVARGVETMRTLFHQHRHELTVTQPTEPIWLYADPVRLEQVVENLLANAAKYSNEGGHVWLTLQQQGNDAVLSVRDCGIGIAPETLPRIFDLFAQAERSLDRSQGGLGIGLTLVKRLVEMHGGEVDVFSQLGVGSEFLVRLPLRSPLTMHPQRTPAETGWKPTPSLRVLVVDDNVDQAQSAALLLRASGHDVQVAFSATTALEVALEFQPNVVLLDIGLPEIDGYEVARRLRQNPHTEHFRLIALTGYGQDTDRQRSAAAGFDAHLVKPVDPRKLEETLSNVGLTDKDNTPS